MSFYESPSDLSGRSFGPGSLDPELPRLRHDLVVREQIQGQERYFIIKDPLSQSYYKFSPVEWDILSLFDGSHSYDQIAAAFNSRHPHEAIDESTVQGYRASLKDMDLLELPLLEKSSMLMEQVRSMRKKRAEGEMSLVYLPVVSWDLDRFFDRIMPYIRFFWTREFFYVSLAAICLMLVIDAFRLDAMKQGLIQLYSFHDKSLWEIFVFLFLMTATGALHELAHGLTLKNYGGEVHKVGFILFYLTPAFFCDISDSYMLASRRQRLWITFAGCYSELTVCALVTFVWFFADPNSLLYGLSFDIMLFTGFSSFALNMNPLIKLDGYYAVMDWLGIPDLREHSFGFLGRVLKRNLLRLDVPEEEEIPRRKRLIFLAYASLSMLYTLFIYYLLLSWVRNIYRESFGPFYGTVFLVLTLYLLFRKKLHRGLGFVRFLYLDKKEVIMDRKKMKWAAVAAAVLALLLLLPISNIKIGSPFVIQPAAVSDVRFEADAFVRAVYVHENDAVVEGQQLAATESPDLGRRLSVVSAELDAADRRLFLKQASADAAGYQNEMSERTRLAGEKQEVERKVAALALKAPVTGTVVTPDVQEKAGSYGRKGDSFCRVADLRMAKIEILVPDYDVDEVRVGQEVRLKTDAYPTDTFTGRISAIAPAAGQAVEALQGAFTRFRVTAMIDNRSGLLKPGMQGDARVIGDRHSLAGRMARELRRWILSRIW